MSGGGGTQEIDDGQLSFFDEARPAPEAKNPESRIAPKSKYSDFIAYVDESGDHGMQNIDVNYPIFVLSFCVFYKRHYSTKVVPALEAFKFDNFGHDIIILHEREIRKGIGPFRFAKQREQQAFVDDLTDIIDQSNFILITCVIDKYRLRGRTADQDNLYHLALGFCLETLHDFLIEKDQQHKKTHVVFECRGKKEDRDLELEFRRICDGANRTESVLPFEIIIADKKANSSGLQLADLVARPVGMSILRPGQANRAFDVLKRKFFCAGGRRGVGRGYENWGLKLFPPPESEKPR